jgi:hypothetical protein
MERKWSTLYWIYLELPIDIYSRFEAAGADEQKPVLCQSEHAMEEAVGFR